MPEVTYVGLGVLTARAMAAVEAATVQAGEDFVGRAMAATPVDTGTLRASEHMTGPFRSGNEVRVKVQTGGEASVYAFFVHEGTRFMAGRPYFTRPLMEMRAVYLAHLAAAARSVF